MEFPVVVVGRGLLELGALIVVVLVELELLEPEGLGVFTTVEPVFERYP